MYDVLTEKAHVINALVPLNRAMNTSSDIINLGVYQSCSFFIQKGAGGVGTATITVDACDNTTPSNTAKAPFKYRRNVGGTDTWGAITSLTASQSFVTTANANDMYEIIIDPSEIAAVAVNSTYGNKFCRVSVVQSDATAVDYGIIAVLGKPRYPQNVPVTGIA